MAHAERRMTELTRMVEFLIKADAVIDKLPADLVEDIYSADDRAEIETILICSIEKEYTKEKDWLISLLNPVLRGVCPN